MDGERSLHADAEGHLADGERLLEAAALAADHDALEHLDALAAGLDDAHVHTHGVARSKGWDVRAQVGLVDEIGLVHGGSLMLPGRRAWVARNGPDVTGGLAGGTQVTTNVRCVKGWISHWK